MSEDTTNSVCLEDINEYSKSDIKTEEKAVQNEEFHFTTTLLDDCKHKITVERYRGKESKSCCKNSGCQLVWGVLLIIISILGFIFPLTDLFLTERLNMRPVLPTFSWWANPPETLKAKIYIFNVTNHERFMKGLDDKINVEELGPITYTESIRHYNVRFHENDTLTYTSKRMLKFLPDENRYSVNDTIITPNVALLGMASMIHNNFIYRTGFKFLLNLHSNQFFQKKTIYEVLWDFRDDILDRTRVAAPGLVPVTNMGIMKHVVDQFSGNVTVKIGPRWGHRNFFRIQHIQNAPEFTGFDVNTCLNNVTDASDGVLFPQHLSKKDVLFTVQKPMCAILPLLFAEEQTVSGIQVYKYNFSDSTFNHGSNHPGCRDDTTLPSGIKDMTKCYFDFPLVLSFPHFYLAQVPKDAYVTGLNPDARKHTLGSVHIEPMSGIPLKTSVKVQCNLWIHNITGLYSKEFDKFSNLIIPSMWIETVQDNLPTKIIALIYFTVVICPILSPLLFTISLLSGITLICKNIFRNKMMNLLRLSLLRNKKLDRFKKKLMVNQELFSKN